MFSTLKIPCLLINKFDRGHSSNISPTPLYKLRTATVLKRSVHWTWYLYYTTNQTTYRCSREKFKLVVKDKQIKPYDFNHWTVFMWYYFCLHVDKSLGKLTTSWHVVLGNNKWISVSYLGFTYCKLQVLNGLRKR
jgi:hypothetical protein